MFSYIRWFSAISFILVVCAAIFLGRYFKEIASNDLSAVVNSNNIALAQGFMNTTWKASSSDMRAGLQWYHQFKATRIPADQWSKYKGYQDMVATFDNFSRSVFKHFEDIPIAAVQIYSVDGTQLISTDQSRVSSLQAGGALSVMTSKADGGSGDNFNAALNGQPSSRLLVNFPIARPDGTTTKGVLIKTLVPIMKDNFVPILVDCEPNAKTAAKSINCASKQAGQAPQVEAVMELSHDITPQWKQLDLFQEIGAGGIISIFMLVISTLLYTTNRAEQIIARQHETNLELAAQAATAQAENRDKSQFLANISHELRTPLNAIIGFSEFIKMERSGPVGNEKYAEYIRDIHSSGVHLLSLINDILDYSKAEADKLELEVAEVDVTKTVKNSMRLVSPRAEGAQVSLVEEIPREHFVIRTDAKKLKQVMLNLLSNAVKFTPAGGTVTVVMWQHLVKGGLCIEVRDTGIGIAPKDISRAMAPFGQVDNTLSRKYEGTGLGLPLTRKFVEIMGGTFAITSEIGKGTVISITLPQEPKRKE